MGVAHTTSGKLLLLVDGSSYPPLSRWALAIQARRGANVAEGRCVLRYDNETGKRRHRHSGAGEAPYGFSTIERWVADFFADGTRWRDEDSNA